MKWSDLGRSSNIEDRRGGGGGFGRMGMGLGGTAVLLVLSLLFGRNLFEDTGAVPNVGESNGKLAPPASGGDGPLLLPQRSEALHRSRLLRRAEEQVRRVGRFRAGVRHRARARASRAAH